MSPSSQLKRRAVAVVQVVALLLLQVYSVLPVFGHFVSPVSHGPVCRGDHRLCGCPLERIANRTCCCFKSSEMAMNMMDHHMNDHKMDSMSKSEMNRLPRFVCPPCGNQLSFVSANLEKIKFLRLSATPEGPDFPLALNQPISGELFESISKEPPDPPPKAVTS